MKKVKYLMQCNPEYSLLCNDEECSHRHEHEFNAGCGKHCARSLGELSCIWMNSTKTERLKLYIKNYCFRPIKEKYETIRDKTRKIIRGI